MSRHPICRSRRKLTGLAHGSSGFALLLALVLIVAITGVVAAIVPLTLFEAHMSFAYRQAEELREASRAAVEVAAATLAAVDDWTPFMAGAATLPLPGETMTPTGADGQPLDLVAATVDLQSRSNAEPAPGTDPLNWRLIAHARLAAQSASGFRTTIHLIVWLADDSEDGDGNPAADSNGIIVLHGEAVGARGARAATRVAVERVGPGPGGVRPLWWRIGD